MQRLAAGRRQVVVHRHLVQRVGEPSRRARVGRPPGHQPGGQQPLQRGGRLADARHPGGDRQRHLLVQHRERRRQVTGRRGLLRYPGHRHRRQRTRRGQPAVQAGQPGPVDLPQQRPDVQGVAAGMGMQPLRVAAGEPHAKTQRQAGHLLRAQRAERDPQAALLVAGEPLPPVACLSGGTARHKQQHPVIAQPPARGQQRLARCQVRPVQVFHQHRHRAPLLPPRERVEQLKPGPEGLRRADRPELGGYRIRDVAGQLVSLGPHHREPGRQPGQELADQRRLPRPGLALNPRHPRPPADCLASA